MGKFNFERERRNIFLLCCADSHLDPLGLHAPRVGGLVEGALHDLTDGLSLGEDLGEVLGAQHVPEGGRRQQPRRVTEKPFVKGTTTTTILETGYKKTGYKNNPDIRQLFPRAKSCNLSTESHIRINRI